MTLGVAASKALSASPCPLASRQESKGAILSPFVFAEFAGLVALVHGADVAVLIGDEKQLPPASALAPADASRSLFSALKGLQLPYSLSIVWFPAGRATEQA